MPRDKEQKRLYDVGYRARKNELKRAQYVANPEAFRAAEHARRAAARAFIAEQKTAGCVVCGFDVPIACDFHHVDPAQKVTEVTRLVYCTKERILEEIAKCILLCSNHHRMLHAGLLTLDGEG